jgi:hypothetical protein
LKGGKWNHEGLRLREGWLQLKIQITQCPKVHKADAGSLKEENRTHGHRYLWRDGPTARGLVRFCFLSFDIPCEVSGKSFKRIGHQRGSELLPGMRISSKLEAKGETGSVHRKPKEKREAHRVNQKRDRLTQICQMWPNMQDLRRAEHLRRESNVNNKRSLPG